MKLLTSTIISFLFLLPASIDLISIKSVENSLVKVQEDLYVNKFETTNSEYRSFLKWAEEKEMANLIKDSKVHHEGWSELGLMPVNSQYYYKHQAFDNYPVVNITYEGALNYCNWLTDQYNSSRKRKFKEVRFRLPTKEEWVSIASGGRQIVAFPWGSPYLKNSKGRYLANFLRIGEGRVKIDIKDRSKIEYHIPEDLKPVALTVPVDQYPQGPYGLHSLSGNVAEMVAEKGSTKGGSFGSSGYYLRINAEDQFEGFEYSPYIGFRYVMEVIEK